jgi:hypothetical protein
MKIKFEWEEIENSHGIYTYRAKVIGGWVFSSVTMGSMYRRYMAENIVFISDPNHEWELE